MLSSVDTARPLPLDHLPDLLQELLPHLPIARASWIVTQLTNRVEAGQSQRIRPYELREGDNFLLGAVLLDQPAASASLLALAGPLAQQSDYSQRSSALLDLIRQQLAGADIRFMQTCVDEEEEVKRLGQLGFETIAELALMVLEVPVEDLAADSAVAQVNGSQLIGSPHDVPTFLQVDHEAQLVHRLCRLAEDSFESTLDCPRLARFRSPKDITAGFCLADSAAPDLWRLVQLDHEDAGCLFLTPHRNRDANDQDGKDGIVALELTYMALLPKFRRRGIAQSVLMEIIRLARSVGAQRIVLAVDNENLPAKKLYQRSGWVEVATEWVLGSNINS